MDESTRARVLDAAGPIFAEKGFQATTVREICSAANVNVAAVNYYFGDKEQLYVETVRSARQQRAAAVPIPDRPTGTAPETRLCDFIRVLITRMIATEETSWQPRLMLREVLQPSSACREMVEDYFRPHFEILLGILDEMLPEDTPLYTRRQIGFSVVGQCLFYRVAGEVVRMTTPEDEFDEHYSVADLAEHISRMTLAALGRTSTLSEPPQSSKTANS